MRVLAIDPGERRLGFAISDPSGTIALPLEVLERAGWTRDLAHLRRLIEVQQVGEIVVGRPLTTRGTVGPQAERAARFAARLRDAFAVPVVEVDERFTTSAAERTTRELGLRGRDRRARRDAIAATFILQPYLDRRRRNETLRGSDEGVMLAP
jgi:putative Holliday junction resolvase